MDEYFFSVLNAQTSCTEKVKIMMFPFAHKNVVPTVLRASTGWDIPNIKVSVYKGDVSVVSLFLCLLLM